MADMAGLISELESVLNDERADLLDDREPGDRIHEIADGCVPIYYRDIAACLADDTSLATLDDEGLADGVTDVFKRIQIAIYERLIAAAYAWLETAREEAEEAEQEREAAEAAAEREKDEADAAFDAARDPE